MTRRGYTLSEVLVAAAVSSVVLAALFSALAHVSRGWRRTDAGVARSQAAQRILDRLADDLAHTEGPAHPTPEMLRAAGFSGSDRDFLTAPRTSAHIINRFQMGQVKPTHSRLVPFVELDVMDGVPPEAVPGLQCRYDEWDPRSVGMKISPYLASRAVACVKRPADKPTVTWLALALGRGIEDDQVIWAFVREKQGGIRAATVLRVSEREGRFDLTQNTPLAGDVSVRDQWLWVRQPSGHEGGEVFELLGEVTLEAPHDPHLPGDPGYRTRRTMTAGM